MPHITNALRGVNWACRSTVAAISNVWSSSIPGARDNTHGMETRHRHAIENCDKNLAMVQALELRMGIVECWMLDSPECHEAAKLLHMHKYQRALDVEMEKAKQNKK